MIYIRERGPRQRGKLRRPREADERWGSRVMQNLKEIERCFGKRSRE